MADGIYCEQYWFVANEADEAAEHEKPLQRDHSQIQLYRCLRQVRAAK